MKIKELISKLKEKYNSNTKVIVPIIFVLVLLLLTVGVTFAVFEISSTGGQNIITTGVVSMSYTESTNVISINDALPISDEEGMAQTNYFDFSVTSNLTLKSGEPNAIVPYEISIEPLLEGYSVVENPSQSVINACEELIDDNWGLYTGDEATAYCNNENVAYDYASLANDLEWRSENELEQFLTTGVIINDNGYMVNENATTEQINACKTLVQDVWLWTFDTEEDYTTYCSGGTVYWYTTFKQDLEEGYISTEEQTELKNIGILKSNYDINYNILSDEEIKVYLTTVNSLVETAALFPTLVSQLPTTYYNNLPGENKIQLLYDKHIHTYGTNSITTNYRLRAWIDYEVDSSTWNEQEKYEYKFKININSDTDYIGYETPSSCFTYEHDENNATITGFSNSCDYSILENHQNQYVVIPKTIDGYTVTEIGDEAFLRERLTNVTIPNSVTTIGDRAFAHNYLSNVIIPNSVTTIGDVAFSGNYLTSVTIPNSVTTIGESAFFENNLTSVTIPNSVTTIGDSAFSDNKLTSVAIPNSVTTIGSATFSGNRLTSVTIPNSVTTIGWGAFRNNSLSSVTIPNSVTTIDDNAFEDNRLTSVTISNSVTTIGEEIFKDNRLTSVTIPNNVTTIGKGAFSFNNLTSVTIPNSVTTIDVGAFYRNNLTSVTIPNSVITIAFSAFSENNLTSVTIPNSVTTIGAGAFLGNNLTSVTIPNSVTTIGNYAFADNELIDVTFPNNFTINSIGIFHNNKLPNEKAFIYSSYDNGLPISTTIVDYGGNSQNVVIPEGVTSIINAAFSDSNLTSVTIPNSVTTIGLSAFANNNLTHIDLPTSNLSIYQNAFNNNKFSGDEAFFYSRYNSGRRSSTQIVSYGGSSKTPVIPYGATVISSYAFNNSGLTSVTIPNSVTTISEGAFGNNYLTSITIPNNVTTIGDKAFWFNNLSNVIIQAGSSLTSVTGIGQYAFNSTNGTYSRNYYVIDSMFGNSYYDSSHETVEYYNNPNLTIYNNSGKSFKWYYAINGTNDSTSATYNFVTGTVPATSSSNAVTITTGTP